MSTVTDDQVKAEEAEERAQARAHEMESEGDERGFEQRLREAREAEGLDPESAQPRKTLAELAADEPEDEDEAEQYTLFGTEAKVTGQVRGLPRQRSSAVSIKSAAKDLPEGQFEIDDTVELRVLGRVDDVLFRSRRDKEGALLRTTRTHVMTMVEVEQLDKVPEEFAGTELDGRGAQNLPTAELIKRRDALQAIIDSRENEG